MNETFSSKSSIASLMPAMSVQQAIERYQLLISFVKELMRDGIDFGAVPGTDKPTLLKPGAEKLATFFGLTKRFSIIEKAEDWTGKEHGGESFFYYLYRCSLFHGDTLVAESDGSSNSWETRYRWRWVKEEEVPPSLDKATLKTKATTISEFSFALDKAETTGQYGKPASYWQMWRDALESGVARRIEKTSRAGKAMMAYEIESRLYRVPNDDVSSQVNTLQKMAQKRSLIAATLLAVNASEFFTQDVEDLALDMEVASVEFKPAPQVESAQMVAPVEAKQQASVNGADNAKAEKVVVAAKPIETQPVVVMDGADSDDKKQPAAEESATEFWKRANAAKIKKDDAMPIAKRAIAGEISWQGAIAELSR